VLITEAVAATGRRGAAQREYRVLPGSDRNSTSAGWRPSLTQQAAAHASTELRQVVSAVGVVDHRTLQQAEDVSVTAVGLRSRASERASEHNAWKIPASVCAEIDRKNRLMESSARISDNRFAP